MNPVSLPVIVATLSIISGDSEGGFPGRLLALLATAPEDQAALFTAAVVSVDNAACVTRLKPMAAILGAVPTGELTYARCNAAGRDRRIMDGPDTTWLPDIAPGEKLLCSSVRERYPAPSTTQDCIIGHLLRSYERGRPPVDLNRAITQARRIVDRAASMDNRTTSLIQALSSTQEHDRELALVAFTRNPYNYTRRLLQPHLATLTARMHRYLRQGDNTPISEYEHRVETHVNLAIAKTEPELRACFKQSMDRLELGTSIESNGRIQFYPSEFRLMLSFAINPRNALQEPRIDGVWAPEQYQPWDGKPPPYPRLVACVQAALAAVRFPEYLRGAAFERLTVKDISMHGEAGSPGEAQQREFDLLMAGEYRTDTTGAKDFQQQAMRAAEKVLLACLDQATDQDTREQTRQLIITVLAAADGETTDVALVPADALAVPFQSCVRRQLEPWHLPPARHTRPSPLRLTFDLSRMVERYAGLDRLHLMLSLGKVSEAEQLIRDGVVPDIFAAAALGQVDHIAALLQKRPPRVTAQDDHQQTALHWAARFNKRDAARLLLEHGADTAVRSAYGTTPLDDAVAYGSFEVACLLIAHHAKVRGPEEGRPSTLASAARRGDVRTIELLLPLAPAEPPGPSAPLEAAIQSGKEDAALILLARFGVSPWVDRSGGAIVHRAILARMPRLVAQLVAAGADLAAADRQGNTPLHVAAQRGLIDVASILMKAHASVQARDTSGLTPLDLASDSNHGEMVTLLLGSGATETAAARFARLWAAGDDTGLKELIGRDPTVIDQPRANGMTLLAYQVSAGDVTAITRLLRLGANPNAKDVHGSCALHAAVRRRSLALVELLVNAKADVNCLSGSWQTPLDIAIQVNNEEVQKYLRSHGGEQG